MTKNDWLFMFTGSIGSIMVGACHPLGGIFMGKMLIVLGTYGTSLYEEDEYDNDTYWYCGGYLILAAGAFIGSLI